MCRLKKPINFSILHRRKCNVLNNSQQPKKEAPKFITMKDDHKNSVEIPVEQENMVTIFKKMGYREVHLDTEVKKTDEQQ